MDLNAAPRADLDDLYAVLDAARAALAAGDPAEAERSAKALAAIARAAEALAALRAARLLQPEGALDPDHERARADVERRIRNLVRRARRAGYRAGSRGEGCA